MKIYNTLTGKKVELKTFNKNIVTIYVCGITPYDTTHLGHAFTYLSFDILVRFLTLKGYKVNYTQNVTDINDRDNDILKRSSEQHVKWQDLANIWTNKFLKDMQYLNWILPNNYLYASKQIKEMISLIKKLTENKSAYTVGDNVYLEIAKNKKYGKLSKLNKEDMLKIAREFDEDLENKDKKQPLDITLWKIKEKDQPFHIPWFDSVFGKGRPGWHLECSAMAISSLGEQIDIHGGGKDLIFPHHEAEIVQSEMATGKIPFAKYWMHTGQVSYKGSKMSKSLGNLVMISDLSRKYSSNAIRFMLLSNHYRNDWEYKEELIADTQKKVGKIEKYLKMDNNRKLDLTPKILECLEDDLNMSMVLNLIYENIEKIDPAKTKKILLSLGFIL
jgi:cysteinyl-tRNA synthetase